MFGPASRYATAATRHVALPGGDVTALLIPPHRPLAPVGFHPRGVGDRLDLLAVRYLDDATGFWRLCDANNALLAGALEQRPLIGIPRAGG